MVVVSLIYFLLIGLFCRGRVNCYLVCSGFDGGIGVVWVDFLLV